MKNLTITIVLFIGLISCQKIDDIGVLVPPTVDQDTNLPSVSINVAGKERLVHVRTFGSTSNPVLFVLHGSFTDTRAYRNICESLSDNTMLLYGSKGVADYLNVLQKMNSPLKLPLKKSMR